MRSVILAYHSLDTARSVISTAPVLFRQHLDCLARSATPVVPLVEIQKAPGSVALTFDDGFGNFKDHALPLLAGHRFPATVFVVTGYCGSRNDWDHGGHAAIPSLPLMGWSDLNELRKAGIEIGAHTVNHLNLDSIPIDRARDELKACREEIENRTGLPVQSLAYPYGASNPQVRKLAREYFDVACGTELRFVSPEDDPYELPRLDAYYLHKMSTFRNAVVKGSTGYIAFRRLLRKARQIL